MIDGYMFVSHGLLLSLWHLVALWTRPRNSKKFRRPWRLEFGRNHTCLFKEAGGVLLNDIHSGNQTTSAISALTSNHLSWSILMRSP